MTTRGELNEVKQSLEKALLETDPVLQASIDTELKLMQNRVKAIKLVLSMPADAEAPKAAEDTLAVVISPPRWEQGLAFTRVRVRFVKPGPPAGSCSRH